MHKTITITITELGLTIDHSPEVNNLELLAVGEILKQKALKASMIGQLHVTPLPQGDLESARRFVNDLFDIHNLDNQPGKD